MLRTNRSQKKQSIRQARAARHKESLAAMLKWLVSDEGIFAKLKFHGNTTWAASSLVWLALLWSWSSCRYVTDAFAEALEGCRMIAVCSPLGTYQGFMKAL